MGSYLTEFRRLSGVGPSLMEATAGLAPEMLDKLSAAFGTKVTEQDVRFLRFRKYRTGVELEDEAERLGGILTSVEDTEVDPGQLVAFLKKHRAKPMEKTEAILGPGAFMALGAQADAEDELGREVIKAFRKNIKIWTDYLDKMTGSRWVADIGELTVDFNETSGQKRSIGVYWDIDVGNNKATFYVEGPRGTGTKTLPRKSLIEPVKPGSPAAFFSWLERSLREALEGVEEAFDPGEQRAISESDVDLEDAVRREVLINNWDPRDYELLLPGVSTFKAGVKYSPGGPMSDREKRRQAGEDLVSTIVWAYRTLANKPVGESALYKKYKASDVWRKYRDGAVSARVFSLCILDPLAEMDYISSKYSDQKKIEVTGPSIEIGETLDPGEQRAISEESVGHTIFQQLGGNRVMAMLGKQAKALILKNGLGLKWPAKEKSKGNYVQIILRDDDTYDMEFSWVSKDGSKKITKTFEGIEAEGLRRSFESWTGWRLGMSEQHGAPVVDERLTLKGWTELTVWGRDRVRSIWKAIQDVTKETKDQVVKRLRKDPEVLKKYTHLFVSAKKPSFPMLPSQFPPGVVVVGFEPVYESDEPGSADKFKTGHGKLDSVVKWLLSKSKRTEYEDGSVLFNFRGRLPYQMVAAIYDAKQKKVLTTGLDRYSWAKGDVGFTLYTGTTKSTETNVQFSAHDETVPASKQVEGTILGKKGPILRDGDVDFKFGPYAGTATVSFSSYRDSGQDASKVPPVNVTVYVDKDVYDAAELADDAHANKAVEAGVFKALGVKVALRIAGWHAPPTGRGMINIARPTGDFRVELED